MSSSDEGSVAPSCFDLTKRSCSVIRRPSSVICPGSIGFPASAGFQSIAGTRRCLRLRLCVARAFTNLSSNLGSHQLGSGLHQASRMLLQNRNELVSPHVTSILRGFGFRELPFGRFLGQFFNALLQLRIGPKTNYGFSFFGKHNLHQRTYAAIKSCHFGRCSHGPRLLAIAGL